MRYAISQCTPRPWHQSGGDPVETFPARSVSQIEARPDESSLFLCHSGSPSLAITSIRTFDSGCFSRVAAAAASHSRKLGTGDTVANVRIWRNLLPQIFRHFLDQEVTKGHAAQADVLQILGARVW